ncbi:type II toxin-antitoxin system RelE/ParE family toxin [Pelagibius sp. CAU 1746]|uniref:type II toxin-antitoxin system RelE/ParE family toxin n=1 Tax=Pelagibius sp. CAU 1746 TaxID=3140370 RepID=UPI00325B8D98
MPYGVVLTEDALRDLDDICSYISGHDSENSAAYVLDRVEAALASLAELPDRGRHPRELADLGITEFREVFFKPYRLIYRVKRRRVVVYVIADGRRDMQSLLARRLLGPWSPKSGKPGSAPRRRG